MPFVKKPVPPQRTKQRLRAKKPIRFDPLTQEILEEPIPKEKKQSAPVRMPIVNALKESAKASSSPAAVSQKLKRKRGSEHNIAIDVERRISEVNPSGGQVDHSN
ncbi:hypothetical protein GGI42DRAFT_331002 [Trichoderma sp. SZMC 28013]